MLTRLKAAWRVLFSEQYIVAIPEPTDNRIDLSYNCCLHNLQVTSLRVYTDAYHANQMARLANEAKAILEKKV